MAEQKQCRGITKSGKPCKRSAGPSGYCWQHEPINQTIAPIASPELVPPGGFKLFLEKDEKNPPLYITIGEKIYYPGDTLIYDGATPIVAWFYVSQRLKRLTEFGFALDPERDRINPTSEEDKQKEIRNLRLIIERGVYREAMLEKIREAEADENPWVDILLGFPFANVPQENEAHLDPENEQWHWAPDDRLETILNRWMPDYFRVFGTVTTEPAQVRFKISGIQR